MTLQWMGHFKSQFEQACRVISLTQPFLARNEILGAYSNRKSIWLVSHRNLSSILSLCQVLLTIYFVSDLKTPDRGLVRIGGVAE